jgi:hypothetical protein
MTRVLFRVNEVAEMGSGIGVSKPRRAATGLSSG